MHSPKNSAPFLASALVIVASVTYSFIRPALAPPPASSPPLTSSCHDEVSAAAYEQPDAIAAAERASHNEMEACLRQQRELTYTNAVWPGFHPLCVESASSGSVAVRALVRETGEVRTVRAPSVPALLGALKPLLESTYGDDDPTIVASEYDYPKHEWRMFTPLGDPLDHAAQLSAGALANVYEGGQFILPGWSIGHVTYVEIPVVDQETHVESFRTIPVRTVSLRPLAFSLEGFLTDEECDFVIGWAKQRLVRSRLAFMDGSNKEEEDVRTSTQVFMPRGGSRTIADLEHRAHNLTRLPYSLGENIQVLKYEPGQKYGAHRDYFSANDYHNQPGMLSSVEYGARNRLATVFWYMSTVAEGGETYFPRALNENGTEYKPWNGDHNDCYRGIAVKPVKGNAVLFYGMLPDGRLDERSLHGGCPPRGEGEQDTKWGANQWIWNQPARFRGTAFPRKGRDEGPPGCRDESDNCRAWASSGECNANPAYMETACKRSCGKC